MKSSLTHNRIKYRLIDEHQNAVQRGEYELARMLPRLLRNCRVSVGLGDVSFQLETIAEKCGCRVRYTRNYCGAEIRF